MKKMQNCRRGFTLIELLIVVAIIGVLATLLMVNFIGVRQRARDSQRKSDLRQIQSALELYRSDQGSYPALPACNGSPLASGSTTYMSKIPCDPSTSASYTYTPSGSGYILYACLENANDSQTDANQGRSTQSCSGATYSFTVQNP